MQGSSRLLRGDHPRMCGEKGLSTFWSRNHSGSPPRMRGKVRAQCVQRDCVGITPAYAGKRPCLTCPDWLSRDHPRVCGEKRWFSSTAILYQGSPPRMRGKAASGFLSALVCRITPAYAGKRYRNARSGQYQRDHPRVCGEKSYQDSQHGCQSGSPPRMRGKDANGLNMLSNLGITPAYAGKRPSRLRRDHERRDHPRVCGEKTKKIP